MADSKWTLPEVERYLENAFRFQTRGCPFCGKFDLTPEFEQMELTESTYGGKDEEGHLKAFDHTHWYLTRLQLRCNFCGAKGSNIERSDLDLKNMKNGGRPRETEASLISKCVATWRTRHA